MNNQIKMKVRKALGNQQVVKKHYCLVCEKETLKTINFKLDKITCSDCKGSVPIDDNSYHNFYQQLNKIGIF